MDPDLIALMIEGEAQPGGGRMGKGSAIDRATMALRRAGFEKISSTTSPYGLETQWYGVAEKDVADDAVDNLMSRAGFVVCDTPDLSMLDMLRPDIDTSKPCLSNKSGDVVVLFDKHKGAVIL